MLNAHYRLTSLMRYICVLFTNEHTEGKDFFTWKQRGRVMALEMGPPLSPHAVWHSAKYPRAYTEQASSRLRASAWLLSRKWTHNSSECLQRDEWLSAKKGPAPRQEKMGFWGGPEQKRQEPAVMREIEADLEGQPHFRAPAH